MGKLRLAYEFYYWLPWWEREPEYPKMILDYIVSNGVTTLREIIDEYMREIATVQAED